MSSYRPADADSGERPAGKAGLRAIMYSDYTIAAVLLGFCAFTYYLTTQIPKVPPALAQGIQPASYPQGVLVFIVAFIVLMLFESRQRPLEIPEQVPGLAYLTIATMFAALIVATWVGFFFGMILFVTICVPLWGMRRYLLALLYAIALSLVLYVMFAVFLMVRFPQGMLTNLIS